jgi:galactose-1-phosphate uridylyltransferase
MSIEYGMKNGILLWIRNPFTGTVTYFNDIHRKPHAFRRLTSPQNTMVHADTALLSAAQLRAEMHRVQAMCVFCPGNEEQTMQEVNRVAYGDIYHDATLPASCQADAWAMRVVHNIIPRIPEECTGGRNESYVIMEDARHFLPHATTLNDLMWDGALSAVHYEHVLRLAVETIRHSQDNPAVRSVLIRKHQGRESGASQPHIHMQVIGADRLFPDLERELAVTAKQPAIWQESVDFMRTFALHLESGDGIVSHMAPFGKFPRHFEVISLQDWGPVTAMPAARLRLFAQYVYRLLYALGTVPYDLELHQGEGIPLHVHLNARRYVYANIGGTLNAPADLAENVIPPIRDAMQQLPRQMAASA